MSAGTIPTMSVTSTRKRVHLGLLLIGLTVLAWSGVSPRERLTWWLEVTPVLLAVPVLLATYRRFEFTTLVYVLVLIHACILLIGGHYTYAQVPPFNWLRDAMGLDRNHYDRLGHLAQGFIPAMVAREILLRTSPLRPGKWLLSIVVMCCLAISAAYELVEWWVSAILHEGANDFLGTQGDVWDTQWDMFCALIGATAAMLTLSRLHDRGLKRFAPEGAHNAKNAHTGTVRS